MTASRVLERLTMVTPLGVRFRDEATGAYVTDALSVKVYPKGQPERRTQRRLEPRERVRLPEPSGAAVGSSRAAATRITGRAETPRYPFVLEVRDGDARYLPFTLDDPAAARRLLGIELASPLSSPLTSQTGSRARALPLFSSPARAAARRHGRCCARRCWTRGPAAGGAGRSSRRSGPGQRARNRTGRRPGTGDAAAPLSQAGRSRWARPAVRDCRSHRRPGRSISPCDTAGASRSRRCRISSTC